MARRFSFKSFKISDLNIKLKFESEELHEDGTILADSTLEEATKILNEKLPEVKDQLPEEIGRAHV